MASSPPGEGRGSAPSPGRGRGGGRGRGRGGGRSGGRNRNSTNKDKGGRGGDNGNNGNGKDGAASPSGNRRRHFSARGGGRTGRGCGGGRGPQLPSTDAPIAKDSQAPEKNAPKPKDNGAEERVRKMSDQDVLIAFGPHVRSGDPSAKLIHTEYLKNTNQREFISNARRFLSQNDGKPKTEVLESKPKVDEVQNEIKPVLVSNLEAGNRPENNIANGNTEKKISEDPNEIDIDIPAKKEIHQSPAPTQTSMLPPPPGMHAPVQSIGQINNNNIPSRPPPGMGSPPPGMGPIPTQPIPTQHPVVPGPSVNRAAPPPGMPPPRRPPKASPPSNPPTSSILPARTPPPPQSAPKSSGTTIANTPVRPVKVRRTQTRCEEQPGRLFANDIPAAAFNTPPPQIKVMETSLTARPRSELTARWVLPLPYLRNRVLRLFEEQKSTNGGGPPQNLTIRDALKNLAVGLFRRGAMDSGSQASIVSKEILTTEKSIGAGHPSEDYFFNVDQRADSVYGTVPFYAPRTPGNVVFRLYYEDEPQVTLATGPCIHVKPTDGDIDSVLRFILSNFKSKKTNGISGMNSLAAVFDLFSPRHKDSYRDGPGRVAWGCMCESRKVVEHAGMTYLKKKAELEERLVAEKEAEKIKAELPDLKSLGIDGNSESSDAKASSDKEEEDKLSEAKTKWASDNYSNERKWREIQFVYASVLRAAVSNDANQLLLKRDILSKIRLEYDLWCSLTETFAPNPFGTAAQNGASKLTGNVSAFPHTITKEHIRKCHDSRSKMQEQLVGFIPQHSCPEYLNAKCYKWKKKKRNFFGELTTAMNELYRDEYAVSDKVWKRREKVRAAIEQVVSASGDFPAGTRVAVFGSSANGFGSPNADLDLCLQVPPSATDFTKENGVEAMTNLASKFTEAGMTDVDPVRLTARIPILKFNVPYTDDGEEFLVECDLSLQNPLACLNTSLLHAYSKISPDTCVIASIIKRWAKIREINNPSQHTLSSYGYVIMLLHFLTHCDFNKNGFIVSGDQLKSTVSNPLLPNLLWVDPTWAQNPTGPYREITARPKNQHTMVQHPTEANYYVNSYFYRSGLEGLHKFCTENHNDSTSLGVVLASFFHFYAYEFDYKKHIVSLNTKHSSSQMEREVKAEEDGWSLFRNGLAIEDPFELFYDVAHVVKANNFQHIRKEFSLAYTKIARAAYTNGELPSGRALIDLICEPVSDDQSSG